MYEKLALASGWHRARCQSNWKTNPSKRGGSSRPSATLAPSAVAILLGKGRAQLSVPYADLVWLADQWHGSECDQGLDEQVVGFGAVVWQVYKIWEADYGVSWTARVANGFKRHAGATNLLYAFLMNAGPKQEATICVQRWRQLGSAPNVHHVRDHCENRAPSVRCYGAGDFAFPQW